MNLDLLEPLLRDRALGELSPAVSALLDAHLAQDPAAARRAAEIAETVNVARAAVAAPQPAPRRALDLARLQDHRPVSRTTVRRTEVLALAACLTLGLGLGWWLRTARAPAPAPSPAGLTRLVSAPPAEPAARFWSVSHFAPTAAKPLRGKSL